MRQEGESAARKVAIEADLLPLESFLSASPGDFDRDASTWHSSRKTATMIAPDDETQVEYWFSSTWQGDDDDVEIGMD